jgi:membrane-bound serine protease (ClpP class)
MKLIILFAIIASFALLATLIVVALYRHKKSATGDLKLIGELATVDTKLDPEGTVIVHGELWRARSNDGSVVTPSTQVRVVGFENCLALVEVSECGARRA